MHTRPSPLPPEPFDAPAATFPNRPVDWFPPTVKPNWRKPVPTATWNLSLLFLQSFPVAKWPPHPSASQGFASSQNGRRQACGGGGFSLAKLSDGPAHFLPLGCALSGLRYACAAGAGRLAGGSSVCRGRCYCRATFAALELRCRRWRREGTEGTCGACVCAREGRLGASSSPRAGWAAKVSSSRRGPGRRHVGGRPMPGGSRQRPRGCLLPCGGLPWWSVHVSVA